MTSKTYKVYHILTPDSKVYKLIDLTGLTPLEKDKVRSHYRPHNYPTVYMSDNKIEPNALFIKITPIELDVMKFTEETISIE